MSRRRSLETDPRPALTRLCGRPLAVLGDAGRGDRALEHGRNIEPTPANRARRTAATETISIPVVVVQNLWQH